MSRDTFMGWSVLIFAITGSATLIIQAYKIWHYESAKSVSGTTVIGMTIFFTSFTIYGFAIDNWFTWAHGIVRVAFWVPVALGFVRYGKPTYLHLTLGLLGLSLVVGLNFPAIRSPIFSAFTFMSIYFTLMQARMIDKKKDRGSVSLWNQISPCLSALTWAVYGIAIGNETLGKNCAFSFVSYLPVIVAWVQYPNRPQPQPAITA